jgi:hypothetical protein
MPDPQQKNGGQTKRPDGGPRLPAVWPALGFTLAYMIVARYASLWGRSGEFLVYLAVMAIVVAGPRVSLASIPTRP